MPISGNPFSSSEHQPHGSSAIHASTPIAHLYMTGDLRAATGLSRTRLDFYLREAIVQPVARTESGYLLFDDAELERLQRVIAWRRDGIGLREIRERLEGMRQASGATQAGAAVR